MKALGNWVAFTRVEDKGLSTTSDDLMHGEVVSFGDEVMLPLKKGEKIIVSTVKKNIDLIGGVNYYFVPENQVIAIL